MRWSMRCENETSRCVLLVRVLGRKEAIFWGYTLISVLHRGNIVHLLTLFGPEREKSDAYKVVELWLRRISI